MTKCIIPKGLRSHGLVTPKGLRVRLCFRGLVIPKALRIRMRLRIHGLVNRGSIDSGCTGQNLGDNFCPLREPLFSLDHIMIWPYL